MLKKTRDFIGREKLRYEKTESEQKGIQLGMNISQVSSNLKKIKLQLYRDKSG